MKREIKFRIWDAGIKRMVPWENLQQHSIPFLFGYTSLPIMQFTGLRDKNGVEIYEGDVVRLTNSSGFHCLATVEFNDGCFDLKFKWPLFQNGVSKPRDYVNVFVANHAIEVIGNKFENPDLAKEADPHV